MDRRIEAVDLALIVRDPALQVRSGLDDSAIVEFADAMKRGDVFPHPVVFSDGQDMWLADGFHRVAAAEQAGLNSLSCQVVPGTRDDALWHAIGANKTHGLRRSTQDKRRAVEMALLHPNSRGWSDRKIGDHCGVAHSFVASVRKSSQVDSESTCEKREGMDGKTYTVPTLTMSEGDKVQTLADQGLGVREIARELDMDKSKVSRILDKNCSQSETRSETLPDSDQPPEQVDDAPNPEDVEVPGWKPGCGPTAQPPEMLDGVGAPVPAHLVDAWVTQAEFAELGRLLRKAQQLADQISRLPGGEEYAQHLGRKGRSEGAVKRYCEHVENALNKVKAVRPHTRCPYCEYTRPGKPTRDCRACRGRGWVTKRVFENSPQEYQQAVLLHVVHERQEADE